MIGSIPIFEYKLDGTHIVITTDETPTWHDALLRFKYVKTLISPTDLELM